MNKQHEIPSTSYNKSHDGDHILIDNGISINDENKLMKTINSNGSSM